MSFISLGSGAAARGLPVYLPVTEAAADASTFVCEFVGGAAANETGVGGGLTGADLVLTQNGSIGAASSGWRTLNGASQYFGATQGLIQGLLGGADFTILHRFRNWTNVANKFLCRLLDTNPSLGRVEIYKADIAGSVACQTTNSLSDNASFTGALGANLGATLDGWFACWKKNGYMHWGFKSGPDIPTGWDFFPSNQRCVAMNIGTFSGDFDVAKHIVGSSSGYAAFDINTLVVSKIGLQAAPI